MMQPFSHPAAHCEKVFVVAVVLCNSSGAIAAAALLLCAREHFKSEQREYCCAKRALLLCKSAMSYWTYRCKSTNNNFFSTCGNCDAAREPAATPSLDDEVAATPRADDDYVEKTVRDAQQRSAGELRTVIARLSALAAGKEGGLTDAAPKTPTAATPKTPPTAADEARKRPRDGTADEPVDLVVIDDNDADDDGHAAEREALLNRLEEEKAENARKDEIIARLREGPAAPAGVLTQAVQSAMGDAHDPFADDERRRMIKRMATCRARLLKGFAFVEHRVDQLIARLGGARCRRWPAKMRCLGRHAPPGFQQSLYALKDLRNRAAHEVDLARIGDITDARLARLILDTNAGLEAMEASVARAS